MLGLVLAFGKAEVPRSADLWAEGPMFNIFLTVIVIIGISATVQDGFGQSLYKWVDESGTVHFSETPPPRNPDAGQSKDAEKSSSKILKNLEMGNRKIPESMKKYGVET